MGLSSQALVNQGFPHKLHARGVQKIRCNLYEIPRAKTFECYLHFTLDF